MKAIASIRNKIKKPSRSTVLFWIVSFIAVLGLILTKSELGCLDRRSVF
jgi:hypothetical protein